MLLSVLALFASVYGIFNEAVYHELLITGAITESLILGSIVQDMISIPASLFLIAASVIYIRKNDRKMLIIMLGLTAYIFYGYALYTIQGQYTSIYLVYLVILSLSVYSMIFGMIELLSDIEHIFLPKPVRYFIAVFTFLILLVLIPAWIGIMTPDIIRRSPGEIYGVFVLDLAIIFPALAIIAFKVLKGDGKGYLLSGVAIIKIFTLCLSVALGEWLKPIYGFPKDWSMILIFSVLTAVSAMIGVLYFARIDIKRS